MKLNAPILLTQDHGHEVGGKSDDNDNQGRNNDHRNDMVTIFVNESAYQVHQGRLDVSKIRELNDIPITDVLYELPEYLLLANDGFVVVHGGEKFKSGGSSGHSS